MPLYVREDNMHGYTHSYDLPLEVLEAVMTVHLDPQSLSWDVPDTQN